MTRAKNDLTQEFVKSILTYDPETGIFCKVGRPDKPVGHIMKGFGYVRIQVGRKGYRAHQLAWLYMTGSWPANFVDHINWDKADNRWANLRETDKSGNMANQGVVVVKPSGIIANGVHLINGSEYIAKIKCKGRTYYGGQFKTIDEAAHCYNKLAIQHFGEFAVLNPIGVDK